MPKRPPFELYKAASPSHLALALYVSAIAAVAALIVTVVPW